MYEIKVKIRHECPYLNIANLFDLPIYSYCSELYDLMVIPQKLKLTEIEKIKSYVIDKTGLEIVAGTGDSSNTFVYFKCMCSTETAVSPRIQNQGGLVDHPIIYEDGWEHYKIVCLNSKTQSGVLKFLQTLENHELVSIRDLGREGIFKSQFISIYDLLNNLTERQVEVIAKAYEEGYYEIPRKIKTEELAQKFNVSRAASEKSLRKAENTIMDAVMPYLLFQRQIKNTSDKPFKIKLSL